MGQTAFSLRKMLSFVGKLQLQFSYSKRWSVPHFLRWIYDDADIDGSRIVWARDLGPERDAELARYFSGRQVWMGGSERGTRDVREV